MILALLPFFGSTQTGEVREQLWLGYFHQARYTSHIGSWLDVQLRTTDHFTENLFQFLIRPGFTYQLNEGAKFTLGYAYLYNFGNEEKSIIANDEHRIWQQAILQKKINASKISFRLRTEQRFRETQKYINRYRFYVGWQFPLTGKNSEKKLFGVASNEFHIQSGKNAPRLFDQNRATIGLGYQLNERLNIQLSYMNIYAIGSSGKEIFTHCIRISLYHSSNFIHL